MIKNQFRITYDGPTNFAFADLNNDNLNNLIVSNGGSGVDTISVFLSLGNGNFQPAMNYGVTVSPDGVVVGNINGDGLLDSASAGTGASQITVLLNAGFN